MTKKKTSNYTLGTAIGFPFITIFFTFAIVPFVLLFLLCSKLDNDPVFSEMKKEFLDKFGTPKRYFATMWRITKDMTKEGNEEMKEDWPVLLGIAIILLPLIVFN